MADNNESSTGVHDVQTINPLDRLIREHRMPVLFVGSGISRRYLGLPSWEELLWKVASTIGLTRIQFNAFKQDVAGRQGSNSYPELAKVISQELIQRLKDGRLAREDFPSLSESEWAEMESFDPFKVLICIELRKTKPVCNPEIVAELDSFKTLSMKIPAVITTNYDDFLEKFVFQDFKPLVFPDDYYFSDSDGYAEILKIHGTMDKPDSIVVTADDYDRFNKESKIVTARISTLLCRHPVVFIGYSLSDDDVNGIIDDLVTSLKQTDLDKIRGRLLDVHVDFNARSASWKSEDVPLKSKRVEVTRITVPNLEILFRYLNRFTPVASANEIKRYREIIADVVLSTDPKSRRLHRISSGQIDDMKPGEYAVMFGRTEFMSTLTKGVVGYRIRDSVVDVLKNRNGILDSSEEAFRQWMNENITRSGTRYVPIFHYLERFNIDYRSLPEDNVRFIDNLAAAIDSQLDKMADKCPRLNDAEDIQKFLDQQVKSFKKCLAVMYYQHLGILDREQSRLMLLALYEKERSEHAENTIVSSELRCAVSYLDKKTYEDKRGCVGGRTIPH